MEEQTIQTAQRQPVTEPPPVERDTGQPPQAGDKERGPLWVKSPPPGVELRGFLRVMLGG